VNKVISSSKEFRLSVADMSESILADWVGPERAAEAAGRIATALAQSAASAKNPKDFFDCTPASVAKVVAIAALTEIMPSTGATALAYAIPRRPRKGEAPQLQYQLSHRGINALAKRAGMLMIAIPISHTDNIEATETGEIKVLSRDIDNPPLKESELRGVQVIVKEIATGATIASGWVSKSMIDVRRAESDSYSYAEKPGSEWAKDSSPWHKWYVEQAMKTAMHYAINRGWCVIDDTAAIRALSTDQENQYKTIEATATRVTKKITKVADPFMEVVDVISDEEKAAIQREEAKL
jgi:recombinational DNA repair protein RecT